MPYRPFEILLVEDSPGDIWLTREILLQGEVPKNITVVTDGEQALESWVAAETAGAPYDLVLMDVQMPKLDGIETTKKIRAREAARSLRHTPIIALTANTLVDDRYACFEAGMDGFLVKPLDRDKLADALATVSVSGSVAA